MSQSAVCANLRTLKDSSV